MKKFIELFDPGHRHMLGDDCGLLDMGSEYLLVTTDITNKGTHFPEGESEYDMGWYSAAINLSDLAAMGGSPLGMLFALAMPPDMEWKAANAVAEGIRDCCARYSVPVLGGDTKEHDILTISGTAVGMVAKRQVLRRKGARPGDIVAVSGTVGRPVLNARNKSSILKVEPRLQEGRLLSSSGGVTSCIDVSDGLSTSLHHLAEASDVGFEVEFDSLPFADGLLPKEREMALHFGGDFELLFTIDPNMAGAVFSGRECTFTKIGQVTDRVRQVRLVRDGVAQDLENHGFEHFKTPVLGGGDE